jgi:hypothetical protein
MKIVRTTREIEELLSEIGNPYHADSMFNFGQRFPEASFELGISLFYEWLTNPLVPSPIHNKTLEVFHSQISCIEEAIENMEDFDKADEIYADIANLEYRWGTCPALVGLRARLDMVLFLADSEE